MWNTAEREAGGRREAACELDLQLWPVLPVATSVVMETQHLADTRTHRKSLHTYCMSKKSWPISYIKLLFNMGEGFLDIYYTMHSGDLFQYKNHGIKH